MLILVRGVVRLKASSVFPHGNNFVTKTIVSLLL